jgi:protein O-mannosyl-transferase
MGRQARERRAKRAAAEARRPEPARPAARRAIGWAAAALGVLLYLNTLGHRYCLDDHTAITENALVKSGVKQLGTLVTSEYRAGSKKPSVFLYRPVPLAMFALEWQLWPGHPLVGHLVNIWLYGLTGWLLWAILRRMLKDQPPLVPIAAVALFMAHPVHTEVVANIKSRDEILGFLFGCLGLLALLRHLERPEESPVRGGAARSAATRTAWLLAALGAFLLALLSKESSVVFLVIYPLAVWFFTDRTLRQNLRVCALFLAPVLLVLMVRHLVLGGHPGRVRTLVLDNFLVAAPDLPTRLASALAVCERYVQLLLFPHPLISDLGYPQLVPVGFGDWRAWVGLLALAALLGWALAHLRRKHVLSFAILFFLIAFAPASNLFRLVGTSYGERLLYVASFGFALGLAWLLGALGRTAETRWGVSPTRARAMAWGLIVVAVGLCGARTVARNPAWRDDDTLVELDLRRAPRSAKLNYFRGLELSKRAQRHSTDAGPDRSELRQSVAAFSEALRLVPGFEEAIANRGTAYFFLEEHDRALTDYEAALRVRPNDPMVLTNLGYIYFVRKDFPRAEEVFRRALAVDPTSLEDRYNLGAVLSLQSRLPEAIEQWTIAVRRDPGNARLYQKIASAYRSLGQPDQAEEWLRQAAARGLSVAP